MARLVLAWLFTLGVLAAGARAACDRSSERPVITFTAEGLAEAMRVRLGGELETALERMGFSVCEGAGRGVSALVFTPRGPDEVLITVEDRITEKTLARAMNLAGFPGDARALALAVAGSELLRASWLENRPPSRAATTRPAAVVAVVDQHLQTRILRKTSIGVAPAFERYSGGETHVGADLFVLRWLSPRWVLELGLGARRGLARTAPHGEIQTSAASGQAGLHLRLAGQRRVLWMVGLFARASVLLIEGRPAPGAYGDTGHAAAGAARAATTVLARSGDQLEWRLTVGAGLPVVGVRALDEDAAVAGTTGIELFAQLGAGLRF